MSALGGGVKKHARALAFGVALAAVPLAACGSTADAAPSEPEGVEMNVFRVPSRHGLAPRSEVASDALPGAVDPEAARTVLMPPDVIADPGEAPDEALERALTAAEPPPAGEEPSAR